MKMNALVILIFLISTDALSEIRKNNKAKCLEELGITTEEHKILKKSSEPDTKLKCYFRCLLEKKKLIADDKIIPGAFKNIMGPKLSAKKVEEVESVCHKATPAKAKCDFGHAMFKCYNSLIKDELLLWRIKNQTPT